MAFFGWAVLFLVFVDELLAIAAAQSPQVAAAVGWYLFASPKARFGGPVSRELGKATVYTLTTAGLWVSGHHDLAIAFLAFSLVINAFAQLPSIRVLAP